MELGLSYRAAEKRIERGGTYRMEIDFKACNIPGSFTDYLARGIRRTWAMTVAITATVAVCSVFFGWLYGVGIDPLTLILLCTIAAVLTWAVGSTLPRLELSGQREFRARLIDARLPLVASYLAISAESGLPLYRTFKEMAASPDDFGEVSVEAGDIASRIDLGEDLGAALRRTANRSVSPSFRELLLGIDNVLEGGGDLGRYLSEKRIQFKALRDRLLAESVEKTKLLFNVYIMVGIGVLFLLIVGMALSIGNMLNHDVINLLVFILLPFVSAAFVVMARGTHPANLGEKEEFIITRIFGRSRRANGLKKRLGGVNLRNLRGFHLHEDVTYSGVFLTCLPVSVVVLTVGILVGGQAIYLAIPASVLISVVPIAMVYEQRRRIDEDVKFRLPDLWWKIASYLDTTTFQTAITRVVKEEDLGYLRPNLRQLVARLESNVVLTEALDDFRRSLKQGFAFRAVGMVARGIERSQDPRRVLEMVAAWQRDQNDLEARRLSEIKPAIFLVYFSTAIFLVVILVLSTSFVPLAAELRTSTFGSTSAMYDEQLSGYYLVCMEYALCIGLGVGYIRDNNLLGGLKQSAILVIGVAVAFTFFVFNQFSLVSI